MQGEGIVSIELAVGAAAFVLGARLLSLMKAARGVPAAHSLVVDALSSGDLARLRKETRGLGYRNPYGEVAVQLLEASERNAASSAERTKMLERSAGIAKRRFVRRTQQGQAMDLLALSVAVGLVAFARDGLPAGPLFWSLAAAVMLLLSFSLGARAQLKANVVASLEALRLVLVARPQLPSLSDGPVDCFWCGEKTEKRSYDLVDVKTGDKERVLVAVCSACGKCVTTLPSEELDSSIDPVSSR